MVNIVCIEVPRKLQHDCPTGHRMMYRHVYADKALGGILWSSLLCQKQKTFKNLEIG